MRGEYSLKLGPRMEELASVTEEDNHLTFVSSSSVKDKSTHLGTDRQSEEVNKSFASARYLIRDKVARSEFLISRHFISRYIKIRIPCDLSFLETCTDHISLQNENTRCATPGGTALFNTGLGKY